MWLRINIEVKTKFIEYPKSPNSLNFSYIVAIGYNLINYLFFEIIGECRQSFSIWTDIKMPVPKCDF